MQTAKFYSHGKLLITGEYVVLDGALAFALPTKYGQDLVFTQNDTHVLQWQSFSSEGTLWFMGSFQVGDTLKTQEDCPVARALLKILQTARNINPAFLRHGGLVKTHLEFPVNWGLGSSSTLINNIALWAKVDPFELLRLSFGGSGYDVACAQNKTPIYYRINGEKPYIKNVSFCPVFKSNLYFIFLNKKQNSRKAISNYKKIAVLKRQQIAQKITQITGQITAVNSLYSFGELLKIHENSIANLLGALPIQSKLFPDYKGAIKSLGAWGGDFIMAAGDENTPAYFKSKGYPTVIPYQKMIL